MTTSFNKQIHALLTQTGLATQKASLVFGFTQGRSESSKDLSDGEAIDFINYLRKQPGAIALRQAQPDSADKMRKKIISLAYEMHWAKAGDWRAAVAAIDSFCMGNKSLFKKALNGHSYKELVQVVSQFEMMYKKYLNKF